MPLEETHYYVRGMFPVELIVCVLHLLLKRHSAIIYSFVQIGRVFMQKTRAVETKQHRSNAEIHVVHLHIEGLLAPEHKLALNLKTRTLSLLSEGPKQIMEQQFSANEMRVLVPILHSFPHYCPYEVLLAHITSNDPTPTAITRCRQRLQAALDNGSWPQEIRPIRLALSSLRNKLHYFNLEVSTIRERGCGLTSLTSSLLAQENG